MNKLLKTITLLLVIAGVVFVAGCANKTTSNTTQGATEQATSQTPVSSEGVNQTQVTASVSANTNVTEDNTASVNETSVNATGNNTSSAVSPNTMATTEQPAENQTAPTAVHLGQAARYQALKKSQQQSTGTANVTAETVNVTQ